jgi:tRNA modification GTPase
MASNGTIYALSSGGLPSGVAVIRMSGPGTGKALTDITGELPPPRVLLLRTFRDAVGETLDRGLVAYFPAPASFTGEDCGELHLHGGRAVVGAVLGLLGGMPGVRPAEAGEFTRRAFANGRLDLTRAEGLSDLIAAKTEQERRLAIATSGGVQERLYTDWRQRLLRARALIEAELDFSDESDVAGSVSAQIWPEVCAMIEEIDRHLSGYRGVEMIRDGYRVAIMGPPNVGKSSLLNAIAGREAAIVTDIPGTTRDIVQVTIELKGKRVVFSDTAGLRETKDPVETIGIDRALEEGRRAQLCLTLSDQIGGWDVDGFDPGGETLKVLTKVDLIAGGEAAGPFLGVSSRTGQGLDRLLAEIERHAAEAMSIGDGAVPTRMRHVAVLGECRLHLTNALEQNLVQPELAAEDLRLAADAIGKLTGAVDVEEMLGAIFSTFCIGK